MLGVFRCVAGTATYGVIVKFIAESEKRARSDSEYRVVEDAPFRRITGLHRERSTLKRHILGWMSGCIVHVHVERFRRGIDFFVKLVRPSSDNLLEIVVSELSIVKRI